MTATTARTARKKNKNDFFDREEPKPNNARNCHLSFLGYQSSTDLYSIATLLCPQSAFEVHHYAPAASVTSLPLQVNFIWGTERSLVTLFTF